MILTGQLTEQCVLYTAQDAHIRDYGLTVLTDGVLSQIPALGDAALAMIETNMSGRLITSRQLEAEYRAPPPAHESRRRQ